MKIIAFSFLVLLFCSTAHSSITKLWEKSFDAVSEGMTGSDGAVAVEAGGELFWYDVDGSLIHNQLLSAGGTYRFRHVSRTLLVLKWYDIPGLYVFLNDGTSVTSQVIENPLAFESSSSSLPYVLSLDDRGDSKTIALYRIDGSDISSPPSDTFGLTIPANAVVIPSDFVGDVEVMLEVSDDLVTWIPASPGVYSSSEKRRFFRVRALKR